jgi:hypothetical protein
MCPSITGLATERDAITGPTATDPATDNMDPILTSSLEDNELPAITLPLIDVDPRITGIRLNPFTEISNPTLADPRIDKVLARTDFRVTDKSPNSRAFKPPRIDMFDPTQQDELIDILPCTVNELEQIVSDPSLTGPVTDAVDPIIATDAMDALPDTTQFDDTDV